MKTTNKKLNKETEFWKQLKKLSKSHKRKTLLVWTREPTRMWSVLAGTLQHLLLHRHHLPTLGRSSVWARRCPVSQPWNPRRPTEQWANEHILLLSTRSPLCGHTAESNTSAHNLPSALPKMTSLFIFFLSVNWMGLHPNLRIHLLQDGEREAKSWGWRRL